jgi:phage baseplate assembly protein W
MYNGRDWGCGIAYYLSHPLCRTIVIDSGKNFQAAALEWFPKYGLRKIDALLITHPHADGEPFILLSIFSSTRDVANRWFSYEWTG